MSRKVSIIEGNSNNKDNVRAFMVKGEKGEQGDLNHNDIIDNLMSSASDKVLSAKQGKQLKTITDYNTENISENAINISNEITARTNADNTLQNNINSEVSARTSADANLQSQISGLASGSPLVASSTSGMTDTSKIYVNTTDGNWYYYNGSQWVAGGTYQSNGISDDSVETSMLNTQIINKIVNLGYEQNGTMHRSYELTYNNVSNHALHYVDDVDAITVTPGTYFFATKITMLSLSSTVRFRAGLRVGSTDRTPKSGTINDSFFYVEDVNATKMCYGLITIPSDSTSFVVRPFVLFVNNDQVNPISASFTIDESYIIKLDSTDENDENNEMADIYQRITTYSFQKAYPVINLTENDIAKITSNYSLLEERVSNVEENVSNVEENVDVIPSYVINYINNIISNFEPEEKSLSIIFQTDHHSNNNNSFYQPAKECIQAANLLAQNLPISLNIFGGDFIANGSSTTKETAKGYMKTLLKHLKLNTKTVLLRGNHDCNQLQADTSQILTDTEIFNILGKKYITNDLKIVTNENIPNPMYGYIDFSFQKIRVVFVNTSDGYDQNIKIGMGNMNKTQLQWLADNAFDLTGKEDYQVVVFGHYPIYDFDDETATVEQGRLEPFKQLLLAFKNGTNLNYTTGGINYTVIKDFTSQGAKKLVAYICGHTHEDKSILTTTGILQIATTNAGYYGKENNVGTVNEFAFDIITIDTQNSAINFNRVGYGASRNFTYE